MTVTQWFDEYTEPVHKGVYERKGRIGNFYAYWNGKYWGFNCGTVKAAFIFVNTESVDQSLPWRGIAK